MKTQTTLAIAAAAVLGFGVTAQADHNDTHRWSSHETRSSEMSRDDRPFLARLFSWPGRAGRTIVHSPAMVGERVSGTREVVTDRTGRVVRGSGEFVGNSARRSGEFVGRTARSTGDFAVRSGRTIVHTPQIIGESLSGRREFITRDGHFLSSKDGERRELVRRNGRGERLYATTY